MVIKTPRKSQPTSFAGANENSLAECTLFGVAKYGLVAAASIIASRRDGGRSMKTAPRMIARKKMFCNPLDVDLASSGFFFTTGAR